MQHEVDAEPTAQGETIKEVHFAGNTAMYSMVNENDPYFRMDCLRTAAGLFHGLGYGAQTVIETADEFLKYVINNPEE